MPDCSRACLPPLSRPAGRARAIATAAMAALLALVLPPPAFAQRDAAGAAPASFTFDIPAQPLDQALQQLARQSGLQLLVPTDLLQGRQGHAVLGRMPVAAALARLLQGSPLAGRVDGGTLLVERASPARRDTALPAVTVVGTGESSAVAPLQGYAARRSATATKTDTPLREVPQSVSVIGRDEMQARGAQDVMEAIRYAPGVTVGTYGPDNRGWEDMQLRGFATYHSSYRDGLAQTPAGVTYYLTEPYGLERIEVLRGPSSMVFGQGDASGVVHRISKRPGEHIREIELQAGSFDRRQVAFDLGDRFGTDGALSYRLVGVGLDSDDQDEYPDGHKLHRTRRYLAPSLRWQPNAATSFTLLAEYIKDRSAEDPYYLGADNVLTSVKMGDYSFSRIVQEQSAIGYAWEQRLDGDWTLRQNLRHSRLRIDRRVVWADGLDEDGHTLHRIARTWKDPMQQTGLDTSLQGTVATGALRHTVLAGIDWNRQRATALRFIGAAPDLDLQQPLYGQPVAMPTVPLADYTQTTTQLGLYLQDQIRIAQRWIATLGTRYDRVRQHTDDRLDAASQARDHAVSSRAGLSYLLDSGWTPYLSYAESFLPNAGLDADSRPFQPSRGRQYEAGVKYQPESSRLSFTAALFDLRKTNVVTYDPVSFDARQIGAQRTRGLELEAKGDLAPGWQMAASATWLNTRTTRSADPDEIGKRFVGIPRLTASVWLHRTLASGLGVGTGVRHIGRRSNDEYNTSFVGSVTLLDTGLDYALGPWQFALTVTNLLDRDYRSICYHGECYRGNLRAATLTARYTF